MQSCVPLPLQKKQLDDLVEKAKDYLLMHGELGTINNSTQGAVGRVKSPNFFMVAAKSLHYDPKRPSSSKIAKLNIGNQLGICP